MSPCGNVGVHDSVDVGSAAGQPSLPLEVKCSPVAGGLATVPVDRAEVWSSAAVEPCRVEGYASVALGISSVALGGQSLYLGTSDGCGDVDIAEVSYVEDAADAEDGL